MMIFLIAVGIALTVSFLCSISEAVLLSLSPAQVADIKQKSPGVGAIWEGFKSRMNQPIAAILVLNTSANVIGATVAGSLFPTIFDGADKWIWLFSIVFTLMALQFGEILPKTMGVQFNARLARHIARPLAVLTKFLLPLIRMLHKVNRPFEKKAAEGRTPASIEELRALAGLARMANQISAQQERIIKTASRLSFLRVEQAMIPVEQAVMFSTKMSLPDAVLAAHIDAHTRFPVCEDGERDRIVGYVNFKEMIYSLRTNPKDPTITGVMHPMHFVPPETPCNELLKFFVDEHEHMAIVRGPDGKTLGLITLEDIMEELLGEMEDEFDRVPHYIHPLSGGVLIVGGGSPITEIASRTNLTIPDAKGTLSGWMTRQLGRTPKAGDKIALPGCEFLVRRTRRGKVFEAAVQTGLAIEGSA
ncbi:MAG: hemolysin family protein [Phycisphaeraceae bacterium]